jgi:hypothetical protein
LDSLLVPVVAGLAVGIAFIVVMIFVGASFENYDSMFYGDPSTNVIFRDPGASEYYPYPPRHAVILVENGVDGAPPVEFSDRFRIPIGDN